MNEVRKKSFWSTLPGILTGVAAVATAVVAVVKIIPNRSPESPTLVYSLLNEAQFATWTSDQTTTLTFGGREDDARGYALWKNNPVIENDSTVIRALRTDPPWHAGGEITGDFHLPRPIQRGDHFRSQVCFLKDAGGEVEFTVTATGGRLSQPVILRKVVDTAHDGAVRAIDEDLSRVAGAGTIRLVVNALTDASEDWALWINPRIER